MERTPPEIFSTRFFPTEFKGKGRKERQGEWWLASVRLVWSETLPAIPVNCWLYSGQVYLFFCSKLGILWLQFILAKVLPAGWDAGSLLLPCGLSVSPVAPLPTGVVWWWGRQITWQVHGGYLIQSYLIPGQMSASLLMPKLLKSSAISSVIQLLDA